MAYASAVSKMSDRGEVELSAFFWPSEVLQYLFIVIIVANHLFLAHFGRLEVREMLHKPISDDPNEVI